MKIIQNKVMTDEQIKYFNTTKTMMLRVRTMLANLSENVDIDDAKSKFKYAENKVDNGLAMLQLLDAYIEPSNREQLETDFTE